MRIGSTAPGSRRYTPPFWLLQIIGWIAFAIAMAGSRIGIYSLEYMVVSKGVLACLGLFTSSALRLIYRWLLRTGPDLWLVVGVTVTASYIGSVAWTALNNVLTAAYASKYLGRSVRVDGWTELLSGTVYHAFALLAWSLLYFGIKYHGALQAERERALKAEALAHKARLQALRYQLNPHFLFNTLNAVSTLVVDARNREASAMLSRLSDFLRLTLDSADGQEIPLGEEIEFVRKYLEIEQVRFGNRLSVQIDVHPEVLSASVPAMILQPLIENAIRHGIAPRKMGGQVTLRAYASGKRLHLHVADDGQGSSGSGMQGLGVGLTNTRARLSELYGDAATIALRVSDGGGVEVALTLPMHQSRPSPPDHVIR